MMLQSALILLLMLLLYDNSLSSVIFNWKWLYHHTFICDNIKLLLIAFLIVMIDIVSILLLLSLAVHRKLGLVINLIIRVKGAILLVIALNLHLRELTLRVLSVLLGRRAFYFGPVLSVRQGSVTDLRWRQVLLWVD